MKRTWLANLLALVALTGGSFWLVNVLWPPLVVAWSNGFEWLDSLFFLVVILMMALPGGLAIVFGVRLFRAKCARNIKNVVGIITVGLVLVLAFGVIDGLLPAMPVEEGAGLMALLLASIMGAFLYAWLATWTLRASGYPVDRVRETLGRLPFVLIAIQIVLVGWDLLQNYAPKKDGSTHVMETGWGLASLIGPIIVAVLFYKISLWTCGIVKREQEARTVG